MAVRAVPCTLGDREFALRLDMGAMAVLEDQGYAIDELVQTLSKDWAQGRFAAKHTRLLLWAMTQAADDPPSLKDIGRWVDGDNYTEVSAAVGEAIKLAFPERPKEGNGQNPRRGVGSGAKSSALPMVPSP